MENRKGEGRGKKGKVIKGESLGYKNKSKFKIKGIWEAYMIGVICDTLMHLEYTADSFTK